MYLYKIIIKNSLFNTAGWAWSVSLRFIALPFIVHKLGVNEYGILIIVSSVMGYFFIFDFGLALGVIKYVAEYYAKNKIDSVHKTINSTLICYSILGFVGMFVLIGLTSIITTRIFKIPDNLIKVATFSFYLASVGFFLNLLSVVYSSALKALQRFDITAKINIVLGTLSTLLIVLILYSGFGLKEVVICNLCITITTLLTYKIVVYRLLPYNKSTTLFDKDILIKIIKYGFYTSISRFSGLSIRHLNDIIIGAMLGTASVTFFAIPNRLISKVKDGINRIIEVIIPVSSDLSSTGQLDRLKLVFYKTYKFSLCFIIALYIPTILFSYNILYYWMGKEFADKSWIVMVLLGLGNFIISTVGVTAFTNSGCGRQDINAVFSSITAFINIISIYPLVKFFSMNGAAFAMLLSSIQSPFAIAYSNKKVIGISSLEFLRKVWLKPIVAGILLLLTIELIMKKFISSGLILIPVFIMSIFLYFLYAYIVGVFEKKEKKQIVEWIKTVLKKNKTN